MTQVRISTHARLIFQLGLVGAAFMLVATGWLLFTAYKSNAEFDAKYANVECTILEINPTAVGKRFKLACPQPVGEMDAYQQKSSNQNVGAHLTVYYAKKLPSNRYVGLPPKGDDTSTSLIFALIVLAAAITTVIHSFSFQRETLEELEWAKTTYPATGTPCEHHVGVDLVIFGVEYEINGEKYKIDAILRRPKMTSVEALKIPLRVSDLSPIDAKPVERLKRVTFLD